MKKKRALYDAMAKRILEKEQQYPTAGVGENGNDDVRTVIEDFEPVVKAMTETREHYIIIGTRDEIKKFTDGINALTGSGVTAVEMEKLVSSMKTLHEYQKIGTPEELQKAKKEENILKFYYCDSEDSYLIGRRMENLYYAHYLDGSWIFDMSRYLPWGAHIKIEHTAWKEHTFPSEPREINFSEWLEGFVKKECGGTPEECQAAVEKQTAKRPDYEGDGYADGHLVYDTWICPCCGKRYEVDYDEYDFCPNCGQKIDWSRDVKGEETGKNEENT